MAYKKILAYLLLLIIAVLTQCVMLFWALLLYPWFANKIREEEIRRRNRQ